jgi:hypothetical protein
LFTNKDGGGFADHGEVAAGGTAAEYFGRRRPAAGPRIT